MLAGLEAQVDVVPVDAEAVRGVLRLLEVGDVQMTVSPSFTRSVSGVKWLRIAVM